MTFPLTVDGSVRLKVPSPEQFVPLVVERVAAMLTELSAEQVFVEGSTVRFRSGFALDRWGWHLLSLSGSGRFRVEADEEGITISYQLSMLGVLLTLTAMIVFFAVSSWPESSIFLFFLPFLVGFFFLLHVMVFIRFSNWLQRGVEDMPEIRRLSVPP